MFIPNVSAQVDQDPDSLPKLDLAVGRLREYDAVVVSPWILPAWWPRRHGCRRAFRHDVATSFIPSQVNKALKRLPIRVYGR